MSDTPSMLTAIQEMAKDRDDLRKQAKKHYRKNAGKRVDWKGKLTKDGTGSLVTQHIVYIAWNAEADNVQRYLTLIAEGMREAKKELCLACDVRECETCDYPDQLFCSDKQLDEALKETIVQKATEGKRRSGRKT